MMFYVLQGRKIESNEFAILNTKSVYRFSDLHVYRCNLWKILIVDNRGQRRRRNKEEDEEGEDVENEQDDDDEEQEGEKKKKKNERKRENDKDKKEIRKIE